MNDLPSGPAPRSTSWAEGFAQVYDLWSAPMTDDIPFYVELARAASGPLVELAVGSGRVAIRVRSSGRVRIRRTAQGRAGSSHAPIRRRGQPRRHRARR